MLRNIKREYLEAGSAIALIVGMVAAFVTPLVG